MNNAILVPTDFSNNALAATKYAAFIATKFNCDLHLLHVYTTYTRAMAGPDFNEQLETHAAERAEENMKLLQDQVEYIYPQVHITSACVRGNLTSEVLKLIKTDAVRFVVMGTKGISGLKNVTIGSNTFDLIQQSPIGILAVPEAYDNPKMERIGMLTNFKESESALLNAFIDRTTAAIEMCLLHVSEPRKAPSDVDIEFWTKVISKRSKVEQVYFKWDEMVKRLDNTESVPNSIEKLIKQNDIDVLLVSYNRKSFFRQIFSKSLTKAIANNLSVPAYFKRDDV